MKSGARHDDEIHEHLIVQVHPQSRLMSPSLGRHLFATWLLKLPLAGELGGAPVYQMILTTGWSDCYRIELSKGAPFLFGGRH
jgi:hypothetical protein